MYREKGVAGPQHLLEDVAICSNGNAANDCTNVTSEISASNNITTVKPPTSLLVVTVFRVNPIRSGLKL